MATLYIREYQTVLAVRHDSQGPAAAAAIPSEPGTAKQAFTYSAATQSLAFSASTTFIMVTSDGTFCYDVGDNPTATTSDFRIVGGVILYMGVAPGQKLSAVASA